MNANLVFLVLVFAAVFTAGQALFGLFTVARQKRQLNKRLKVAEKVDGVSALVMELRKQRGLNADGRKGERLRWLSNLIVASGITYEPRKWAMMDLGTGLACYPPVPWVEESSPQRCSPCWPLPAVRAAPLTTRLPTQIRPTP